MDFSAMTLKQLEAVVGSLSNPSKMPSFGTSIPNTACITGMKLQGVPGSVCENCYAGKGRYAMPNVQNAMGYRLQQLSDPGWVDAMAELISRKEKSGYFRWHDSGDLQGLWHIDQIVRVCEATPHIRHWLPTKETRMVRVWEKRGGKLPPNLVIRHSAHMKDELPEVTPGSMVLTKGTEVPDGVHECPAYKQDGFCGNCRFCWEPDGISAYPEH